jgi:hypothetical protein
MKFVLGALAAILLTVCGTAWAQPMATPAPMKLALAYDGRLFIKVLDIRFDQTVDADGFGSRVRMKSYGVLALFKRFDIQAEAQGRIEGGEVQPATFGYVNRDGERVRRVKVAWTRDDVTMTSTPAFSDLGRPPATREQRLAAADPLTQMIRVAVTQKPGGACNTTLRFFDGKQLYDLAFGAPQPAALGDEQQALGLVNPVRCTVRYQEIAGFKPKSPTKPAKTLNSPIEVVMGQLGGGGPWVFASMSADTGLGKAKIVLRRADLSGGLR